MLEGPKGRLSLTLGPATTFKADASRHNQHLPYIFFIYRGTIRICYNIYIYRERRGEKARIAFIINGNKKKTRLGLNHLFMDHQVLPLPMLRGCNYSRPGVFPGAFSCMPRQVSPHPNEKCLGVERIHGFVVQGFTSKRGDCLRRSLTLLFPPLIPRRNFCSGRSGYLFFHLYQRIFGAQFREGGVWCRV